MEEFWRTLAQVGGYLLTAGVWVWTRLRPVAAEAVAYAEKYYADGHLSDRELEEIAVKCVRKRLPWVPEFVIRKAIQAICARRKAAAEEAGVKR